MRSFLAWVPNNNTCCQSNKIGVSPWTPLFGFPHQPNHPPPLFPAVSVRMERSRPPSFLGERWVPRSSSRHGSVILSIFPTYRILGSSRKRAGRCLGTALPARLEVFFFFFFPPLVWPKRSVERGSHRLAFPVRKGRRGRVAAHTIRALDGWVCVLWEGGGCRLLTGR